MACSTISTSGTVTLTAGTLSNNFCHTSWQNTLDAFVSATSASMSSGALFAANSTAPATNMLWLKQDESASCAPLGWYYHDGSSWEAVPLPAASLPSGVVTAGTKGSASKNAVVTVDTYGRVTGLTEVDPTAESTDGHAKAWVKFSSTASGATIAGTAYNIASVNRTSAGTFTVTTTGVTFSNQCLAVASGPGQGDYTASSTTTSFTGADHIRVATTISSGAGVITVTVPMAIWGGEDGTDGDENWTIGRAEANGVSLVIFGN